MLKTMLKVLMKRVNGIEIYKNFTVSLLKDVNLRFSTIKVC